MTKTMRTLTAALLAGIGTIAGCTGAKTPGDLNERARTAPPFAHEAWPSIRDGFGEYQAAQRFRDCMEALLELPGHDPALRHMSLAEIVRAFEESQLIDAPPPWRRALANASIDRDYYGVRVYPGVANTVPLDAPSRTVPVSGQGRWRTLLSDGRVVEFTPRSGVSFERPKVYADDEKIVVLEIGFDSDPCPIVVYESDAMERTLWHSTAETDQGIQVGGGSGSYWSNAWLVIRYGTYYVFGLHGSGFYYHAFDAETGDRLAGYAYDAPYIWRNPETNRHEFSYDGSEPAGRAFPPAEAYRGW